MCSANGSPGGSSSSLGQRRRQNSVDSGRVGELPCDPSGGPGLGEPANGPLQEGVRATPLEARSGQNAERAESFPRRSTRELWRSNERDPPYGGSVRAFLEVGLR